MRANWFCVLCGDSSKFAPHAAQLNGRVPNHLEWNGKTKEFFASNLYISGTLLCRSSLVKSARFEEILLMCQIVTSCMGSFAIIQAKCDCGHHKDMEMWFSCSLSLRRLTEVSAALRFSAFINGIAVFCPIPWSTDSLNWMYYSFIRWSLGTMWKWFNWRSALAGGRGKA